MLSGLARSRQAVNALPTCRLVGGFARPYDGLMTPENQPAGYERIEGANPPLFLCDHAANALPPGYQALGLAPALFQTHIAYDIGAAEVTRTLAGLFGSPALLGVWSRLLIDLNRGPDDPTLVMKLSDGSIIPGNRHADSAEVAKRIAAFHAPYHQAIEKQIARLAEKTPKGPPLVSMHSFTPSWKGNPRPWEIGILWDRDGRLAQPLMTRLAQAGFRVGDNEPYSGALEGDTLNRHGTRTGLPHVLIEMRQDLIGDAASARALAHRLQPIIAAALADCRVTD
jgi:predicted N-formylglutamate amidohydrolase